MKWNLIKHYWVWRNRFNYVFHNQLCSPTFSANNEFFFVYLNNLWSCYELIVGLWGFNLEPLDNVTIAIHTKKKCTLQLSHNYCHIELKVSRHLEHQSIRWLFVNLHASISGCFSFVFYWLNTFMNAHDMYMFLFHSGCIEIWKQRHEH